MKRTILNVIIAFLSITGLNAATLTQEADSAYMNDDFARAASLYEQIAREEGTSSDLFYNLGNAYYRQGQLGKAILYYERALRLDPTNADARTNLAFVNSKITDEPGDRGMFISNTMNSIAQKLHANTWAAIAIAAFVALLAAIAIYIFTSQVMLRKAGFFGGIILLIVWILANVFASRATGYSTDSREAIVITPSTILSTSPRTPKDRSEEAMLLHEGTKVEIIDSVTTRIDSVATKWFDVRVDNDHRAWINGNAVERI